MYSDLLNYVDFDFSTPLLVSLIFIAMPPKRKATGTPTGGKQVMKGNQIKKECIPAETEEDIAETSNTGKIIYHQKKEKTAFLKFKREVSSSELLNKNENFKEIAYPNIALNQSLQQKTKINMQGSIKWK